MTEISQESNQEQISETAALDSVKTKTASVAEIVAKMEGASGEDITKIKEVLDQIGTGKVADNVPAGAAAKNKASVQMTKEDLATIFGDEMEDLSEEFLDKITTLFEAAISLRVAVIREEVFAEAAELVESEVAAVEEKLIESMETYMNEAIEEWQEENKVEIQSALKMEQLESFVEGMRTLFLEHDIEIPEDKLDLVEDLNGQVEELKAKLNDALNENIELEKVIAENQTEKVFAEASEGLAATQVEKLKGLTEGLSFNDVEDYRKKVALIRESHFGQTSTTPKVLSEDLVLENETPEASKPTMDPSIARIADAIRKTNK